MMAILVLYIAVAIIGFVISAETLDRNNGLPYNFRDHEKSRIAAFCILTSWIWPIWIPILIGYYIIEAIYVLTGRKKG